MKTAYLLLLLVLYSCLLKSEDKVNLENFDFHTNDSNELFFKNIRQSDYHIEELKEAKMNIFRLKAYGSESPFIQPIIIHNWGLDQASIWLELDSTISVPLSIELKKPGNQETLLFNGQSRKEHLEVSNRLFEALLDSSQVFVGDVELLKFSSEDRKNYRIVLNDYYRLVALK